ncbi:MAG: glycosyltransferase family 4 protein [Anaerolineales bacterium]
MAEDRLDRDPGKVRLGPTAPAPAETSLPGKRAATSRPRVLVVGPGPAQVGGVTTFIRILMSSRLVAEKYELIRLDTTRVAEDVASAGRFSLRNLSYLLSQICRLVLVAVRQRPVVMHIAVTSGWSFWKGGVFLLIGRAFRIRSVAHLHGGSMREYYRKRPRPVRCLIGWVLRRADVVIALSGQWQRFLIDEVRSDLRVVVMPNTVDTLFAAAAEQDDYASRQSGKVVLFVGHLGQAKGVFDILRAVPLVLASREDAVFLFAGGAHEARILEEMQRYSAEASLGNAVQFLGEVTGQAKLDLFRRATLFILPSYVEGLPYSLLEAMAVGLPVITTTVGAIPEIIEEGHHGFLIQPGDYAALARRIILLLGDESLGQRMGLANRRLIRDHYLPDAAMTQLVAIYDRLQGIGGAETLQPYGDGGKEVPDCSCTSFQANSSLEMKDEHKEKSHGTQL